MRKYTTAPHPFVIEPCEDTRTVYEPGEELTFHLVLIGKAIDYLPYFIYTFEEIGKRGIGKKRGKYVINDVYNVTVKDRADRIYSGDNRTFRMPDNIKGFRIRDLTGSALATLHPERVTLTFITPTRIVFKGHLIDNPEFHILMRSLIRRIALLSYFHCGGDPSGFDFKGFIDQSTHVKTLDKSIRWHDWERYSTRQDTRMKLGGFIGSITFAGNLESFMPYLLAGEYIHMGKNTAFGLGRYVMDMQEVSYGKEIS